MVARGDSRSPDQPINLHNMKKIQLNNESYLFHMGCKYNPDSKKAILIVPSGAGYYAENETYGKFSNHIDNFVLSLSDTHNVYYLVLPGQDPSINEGSYSWEASVRATAEAVKLIQKNHSLIGIVGMCTGGVIAVEALAFLGLSSLPIVLYNSSYWVGWQKPKIQDDFHNDYPHVRLDRQSLLRAPNPVDIIPKHRGRIFQILCRVSRYPVGFQQKMKDKKKDIEQVLFDNLGDVPDSEAYEYQGMISIITHFFS